MEKIIKYKWKIAATTLVTFPLSIYFIENTSFGINENIIIFLGMFPLLFSVTVEIFGDIVKGCRQYIQTGEFPPSELDGSPTGNKIAIVLAILFGLIFVLPIVWIMLSNLI